MKGYTRINSKILTIKLPPRKVPPILSNSIHAKIVKKCGGICSGQVVPTSLIAHGPRQILQGFTTKTFSSYFRKSHTDFDDMEIHNGIQTYSYGYIRVHTERYLSTYLLIPVRINTFRYAVVTLSCV